MYNNYPIGFGSWNMSSAFTILMFVLAIWALIWKGWALWRAARNNSTGWFIALLVLNTLGILEIIYIFAFSGLGKNGTVEAGSKDVKHEKEVIKEEKTEAKEVKKETKDEKEVEEIPEDKDNKEVKEDKKTEDEPKK